MKIKHVLTVTSEETGEEMEIELASKWVICDHCQGSGTTTRHIDGNGLDEEQTSDPDFMEDYMQGVYDKPCPECQDGKAWVVDTDRLPEPLLTHYHEHLKSEAEYRQMCEMERRMGA